MKKIYLQNTTGKKECFLSVKLGSGGEGTVHSITDNPDFCVKIYHNMCVNTQVDANATTQVDANGKTQVVTYGVKKAKELEQKIKAMIEAPPRDPTLSAGHYSICWPTHLVYEDEACTKFLGYAMPLIDKKIFKEYHLLCDKPGSSSSACYRLENFGTGFTYLHMYVVALNLASCVMSIHEAGHAIGDLNDKNILVSTKDSKITIVDCDSFEIHAKDTSVFPCTVYMPEYSAPEVIKHVSIADRQKSDRFALAVLVFKLLMLNTHPYSSRGSSVEHLNTPGEKIAGGYYPYEDHEDLDVSPPVYALPYAIIPPNIRALFKACFMDGQHAPQKRPTPREWFLALKENYESMFSFVKSHNHMCEANHLHMYPLHLTECPWCEMKDDYFPHTLHQKQKINMTNMDLVKDLKYLESVIDSYAKDDHIDINEIQKLNDKADVLKISKDKLNSLLSKKIQSSKTILGDKPYLSETYIDMGEISTVNTLLKKQIFFTNPLPFQTVKFTIINSNPSINVHSIKNSILPGQKITLNLFVHSNLLEWEKLGLNQFEIIVSYELENGFRDQCKFIIVFNVDLMQKKFTKILSSILEDKVFLFLLSFILFTIYFIILVNPWELSCIPVRLVSLLFFMPISCFLFMIIFRAGRLKDNIILNTIVVIVSIIASIFCSIKSDYSMISLEKDGWYFVLIAAIMTSLSYAVNLKHKIFNSIYLRLRNSMLIIVLSWCILLLFSGILIQDKYKFYLSDTIKIIINYTDPQCNFKTDYFHSYDSHKNSYIILNSELMDNADFYFIKHYMHLYVEQNNFGTIELQLEKRNLGFNVSSLLMNSGICNFNLYFNNILIYKTRGIVQPLNMPSGIYDIDNFQLNIYKPAEEYVYLYTNSENQYSMWTPFSPAEHNQESYEKFFQVSIKNIDRNRFDMYVELEHPYGKTRLKKYRPYAWDLEYFPIFKGKYIFNPISDNTPRSDIYPATLCNDNTEIRFTFSFSRNLAPDAKKEEIFNKYRERRGQLSQNEQNILIYEMFRVFGYDGVVGKIFVRYDMKYKDYYKFDLIQEMQNQGQNLEPGFYKIVYGEGECFVRI